METAKVQSVQSLNSELQRIRNRESVILRQLASLASAQSLSVLLSWAVEYFQTTEAEFMATVRSRYHIDAQHHFMRVCQYHGYTPELIAELMGFHPSTVRRILKAYPGRCLDSETFRRGAENINQFFTRRAATAPGFLSSSC